MNLIPDHAVCDASVQKSLTTAQIDYFRHNGFLVVRNLVIPGELTALASETERLVREAEDGTSDGDFYYRNHEVTGKRTPYRIEYIIDKADTAKSLLGHPKLLAYVESLQGPQFIPTWDSLVFKLEGAGIGHAWHRDAAPYTVDCPDWEVAAVDIGVYLDQSDLSNCLWIIPGSHQWPEHLADMVAERLGSDAFGTFGALPVTVSSGDAIIHNIMTLHGSPPACSRLRRVIYFEFRMISAELRFGPHTPEYIPLKQGVLVRCVMQRLRTWYGAMEEPFKYHCLGAQTALSASESTYRYAHEAFWRHHTPFGE